MRISALICLLAWSVTACGWGLARPTASGASPGAAGAARAASVPVAAVQALHYTVSLDLTAQRLDVAVGFEGRVDSPFVYGTRAATEFLRHPEWVTAEGERTSVAVRDGLLHLPPGSAIARLEYAVDVRAALARDSLLLAYPGDGSLLLAAELFLWRPQRRSPQLQSTLRFVLPDGVQVSAPWPELNGGDAQNSTSAVYQLSELAFGFTGHVVLGALSPQEITVPGTQLRAAIMPGFPADTEARIGPWLARAAKVASLPGGFFPVPDAQVIVVPTSPLVFPIYFGHTGRSGGASVVLFLPTDVSATFLAEDWIAIHEFCHLWHPFVQRQDAWLSEGIATYLQEVLRAQAGMVARAQVWQRMYEGAQLGRGTSRSLAEETRRMPFEHNYQRVYWAGAAIALMIDVELRTRSSGRLSLPGLLARMRQEPQWYTRARSAREILGELDRLSGLQVGESISSRYLEGKLPDLTGLYERLGVVVEPRSQRGPKVAPLAWVRDAIMRGPDAEATARPLGGG